MIKLPTLFDTFLTKTSLEHEGAVPAAKTKTSKQSIGSKRTIRVFLSYFMDSMFDSPRW